MKSPSGPLSNAGRKQRVTDVRAKANQAMDSWERLGYPTIGIRTTRVSSPQEWMITTALVWTETTVTVRT